MTPKPIRRREAALDDADQAVIYYAREAGLDVALRFIEALGAGYRAAAERPGAGALRLGQQLKMPGLRSRRVARFPYFIFYKEFAEHVEVLRVLHARSDILTLLAHEDSSSTF